MDHCISIKVPLLISDIQKERLERMGKRYSDIMLIPKEYWCNTGLGRFLPKNTLKVKSIKRGERPGPAKEVEVASVPVHVVWDDDVPGGILYNVPPEVPLSDNDYVVYKKYGKTISEGLLNPTSE